MGILSRLAARGLALPAPATRRVRVERRHLVPMRDGVRLRTDHYAPALSSAPTVLMRTPYGLNAVVGLLARTVAEQGFHVVLQSCRGTGDSEGEFEPMRHERADGLDTVDWLRAQPWYSGELCTFGPSYVGFVQWAIAADVGPELKAIAPAVSASDFRDSTYPGGSFALDTVLTWATLLHFQKRRRRIPRRVLDRALAHLPLGEADLVATGAPQRFMREWLDRPGPEYWDERGHSARVGEVDAAVLMVGGWHDIFLPWQLADYAALRAAGANPRLVIGPWTHGSLGLYRASVREAVDWFHRHTKGHDVRHPEVRIQLDGATREWRDLPDWPPPGDPREWAFKETGTPDRFRYDPADPTPAVGGPRLLAKLSGPRDNRALEARADVLVYTGEPLAHDTDVVGPVDALVDVDAEGGHFDVFVRLCDVDSRGRSVNVCDGLRRVDPDTPRPVEVRLWPAGYRFAAGHRMRVQVSGGAHPRYARHTGTGDGLATATAGRPVDIEVRRGLLRLREEQR